MNDLNGGMAFHILKGYRRIIGGGVRTGHIDNK